LVKVVFVDFANVHLFLTEGLKLSGLDDC